MSDARLESAITIEYDSNRMRNTFLRTLVFACSLTLALPQGWCCLLAMQNAAKGSGSVTPSSSDCCPCSAPQPENSKPDGTPSEKSPVPIKNCPCTERNTTLITGGIEKIEFDLGFVAILPVADFVNQEVGARENVARSVYLPPQSLHVLHCLWLC